MFPHDVAGLERQIAARFASQYGQPADAEQVEAIVARASLYYQQTRDAGRAIEAAMLDVASARPETRGVWNPLSTNRTSLTRPLPAARDLSGMGVVLAPPMPSAGAQPTANAAPADAGGLPAAARERLREGVNATFANGQVWTLRGGVPARVQ